MAKTAYQHWWTTHIFVVQFNVLKGFQSKFLNHDNFLWSPAFFHYEIVKYLVGFYIELSGKRKKIWARPMSIVWQAKNIAFYHSTESQSAADVKMEIPALIQLLKSSIVSLTSFLMGKTFWWVVSAAVEQSRRKPNIVAQGDRKFYPWGWPQDPSKPKNNFIDWSYMISWQTRSLEPQTRWQDVPLFTST